MSLRGKQSRRNTEIGMPHNSHLEATSGKLLIHPNPTAIAHLLAETIRSAAVALSNTPFI